MFKNLFQFSYNDDVAPAAPRGGAKENASAVPERKAEGEHTFKRPQAPNKAGDKGHKADLASVTDSASLFESIYQNAAVKPPSLPYGILKVAEMLGSQHLSGMASEAKRCALLMALDAAGAEVEDLLQDAVVRQRALNDYEEAQQDRLRKFEAEKGEENRHIQAELDRLTSQYMSRIQNNVNEVARAQDDFRDWQKRKQEESQRIANAAGFCVPQGVEAANGGLAAVLERASGSRR